MDVINQTVSGWSSTWVLVGHTMVCGGCMVAQAASDAHLPFVHAAGCRHAQHSVRYPWHEIDRILRLVINRPTVTPPAPPRLKRKPGWWPA